jgi:hypothetical protein
MPAASVKVLNEILALAYAGVPILLPSTVPSRSISLDGSDSEVVAIAAQLWGLVGNGKVFVGNCSTAVLTGLGIQPDLTFTSSSNDAAIYFAHNLCRWRRCILHQQWIEEAGGCDNQCQLVYRVPVFCSVFCSVF